MDGNATVVTVTYTNPDTIDKTEVDRILSISVDLAFNGSNKVISYAGHSFNILGNTDYIPSQINDFTPTQLFKKAHKDLLDTGKYDHWFPKLQDEIEEYINESTKGKKSFSMKGDLNKAIFVATYLYYLNAYPSALEERHAKVCDKLNISSGTMTKNLSRISVDFKDCSKYAEKNGINLFTKKEKMTIKDKDVYLYKNSKEKGKPTLKGGYLSAYAIKVIEDYMHNYWLEKDESFKNYKPSLNAECKGAFVSEGKKK